MASEDILLQKRIDELTADLLETKQGAESLKEEMEVKKSEEIQLKVDAFELDIAEFEAKKSFLKPCLRLKLMKLK